MEKIEEENKIVQVQQPQVNVGTLIVAKPDRDIIALGDAESFRKFIETISVKAILWNEDHLIAMTDNRGTILAYKPEIEYTTKMFFVRDDGRRQEGWNEYKTVWEGEYKPIEFTKGNLIKFLKTYGKEQGDLINNIKNMKVIDKIASSSEMIDLGSGEFDDQNIRTVEEETSITNIPNKFSLILPVIANYNAKFEFEAKIIRGEDKYGNPNRGKAVIQVKVLNAREVMRGVMYDIMSKLPKEIPKYYGRMSLKQNKGIYE
jgi:hypothetical protein